MKDEGSEGEKAGEERREGTEQSVEIFERESEYTTSCRIAQSSWIEVAGDGAALARRIMRAG